MLHTLVNFDAHLFLLLNSMHTSILDPFFVLITYLGNGWVLLPILLTTLWFQIPQKKRYAMTILIAIITMSSCAIINLSIKKAVDRPRPLVSFNPPENAIHRQQGSWDINFAHVEIHVLGPTPRGRSFPSGHTNAAFSAAGLLIGLFGGVFWAALIPAFLVGYSRIYLGVHFPLDVLAGALLGFLFTYSIMRFYSLRILQNGKVMASRWTKNQKRQLCERNK